MEIASIDAVTIDGVEWGEEALAGVEFDPDTGWTNLYGRKVKVTYTAGFEEVPANIKTAALDLGSAGPRNLARPDARAGRVRVADLRARGRRHAHHGRRHRRDGHSARVRQRPGHRPDVQGTWTARAPSCSRQLDVVGQHHQGDHQGHRDRHRGARRDRAVRLLHRCHPRRARGPLPGLPRPVRRLLPADPGRCDHRCRRGVPVLRARDQRRRPGRGCCGPRGASSVPGDCRDHGGDREAGSTPGWSTSSPATRCGSWPPPVCSRSPPRSPSASVSARRRCAGYLAGAIATGVLMAHRRELGRGLDNAKNWSRTATTCKG